MQRNFMVLLMASFADLLLLLDVTIDLFVTRSIGVWFVVHIVVVTVGALALVDELMSINAYKSEHAVPDQRLDTNAQNGQVVKQQRSHGVLIIMMVLLALMIPGVGLAGMFWAFVYAAHSASKKDYSERYWQVTQVAALPYSAPRERVVRSLDGRGYVENIKYSTNNDEVYRKVLAADKIKTSLSVDMLQQAVQHTDERVRLSAYKTLEKNSNELNGRIQQLKQSIKLNEDNNAAGHWLQIANNYWELKILEGGGSIASEQHLINAAKAAIKSVSLDSNSRNAHLVLGRIYLAQGDTARAKVALERSYALGMPAEKVVPYIAECAFMMREFLHVKKLLGSLHPSVTAYPPLSHVVGYWT